MQKFIQVRVLSIRELLSGAFQFKLPWFQRAYAWLPGEAARLVNDLIEAMERRDDKRRYFLGNLMLAKPSDGPETSLVDGHQRVMTLTILFAVLRDLETVVEAKEALHTFIAGSEYRLISQDSLKDFVERYVQAPGSTGREIEEDYADLSETEHNIIDNRDYMRSDFIERGDGVLRELASFLADHCFVSVTLTKDEAEAWRFLQIEEDTRHGFNSANRAKASLLAIVPPNQREHCRKSWERAELKLESKDVFALLGFIRAIKLRKMSEKPVDSEIAEIGRLDRDAIRFMDEDFEPGARRLAAIRGKEVGPPEARTLIGNAIEHATWVSTDLWLPAAMRWLEVRGEEGETATFFARLERLVWILRIAGIDPARHQKQLLRLLHQIDRGQTVDDMQDLVISRANRAAALESLRARSFHARRYANKVLRRISVAAGFGDPGPIHPDRCTIEHILPSGWLEKSGWRRNFDSRDALKSHVNMLGNLTFLTGPENSEADSRDWPEKRPIYRRSAFAMSNEVAETEDWNRRAIEERTERLIKILFDSWELPV